MPAGGPRFAPGTLGEVLAQRARAALACGALRPVETVPEWVADAGARFLVRRIGNLARKELETAQRPGNPFLPWEEALFVAEISDSHVALLNKFNVIAHHLLIVTRRFEDQELLLSDADFAALLACMAEFPSLGFYNGGAVAGASQSHKHLQLVPLPLTPEGPAVPAQPLLDAARFKGGYGTVPAFPFAHALCPRPLSAKETHELYLRMLRHAGIPPWEAADGLRQSAAYNLLLGPSWMLLVPRTREFFDGISVNALAYAGSLFVRSDQQLERIREAGPMAVLAAVGRPQVTG
ncbi:MAG TPA: phosphorylase [Burkholderiales bacterium]